MVGVFFGVMLFSFVGEAQEILMIRHLQPGSTLDLPAGTSFQELDLQSRRVRYKFSDAETSSACSLTLTGSEAPVRLSRGSTWNVTSLRPTTATPDVCRKKHREKLKADYDGALQALEQNWLDESPITRSLQRRKMIEKYLRAVDQLNDHVSPCSLAGRNTEDLIGPPVIVLKSSDYKGRELEIFCDQSEVPVVALNNQGWGVLLAPARSQSSSARMPASFGSYPRAGAR